MRQCAQAHAAPRRLDLARVIVGPHARRAAAEAQRTRWTQEYIARVLRIVQQDTEAMQGGGMDVPVEEVMDVLRKE